MTKLSVSQSVSLVEPIILCTYFSLAFCFQGQSGGIQLRGRTQSVCGVFQGVLLPWALQQTVHTGSWWQGLHPQVPQQVWRVRGHRDTSFSFDGKKWGMCVCLYLVCNEFFFICAVACCIFDLFVALLLFVVLLSFVLLLFVMLLLVVAVCCAVGIRHVVTVYCVFNVVIVSFCCCCTWLLLVWWIHQDGQDLVSG